MESSKTTIVNTNECNKNLNQEQLSVETKIIDDKVSELKQDIVVADDIEKAKIFSVFKDGIEIPILETNIRK